MSQAVKTSNGEVTGFRVRDFQYSTVGMLILYRLLNNRDVKIIITSKGNTTGTGKTQLAVILARVIAQYAQEVFEYNDEWEAKRYSFMDVYEYLEKYAEYEGRVLITDEMEFLADKRRSMSDQNVHFSQAWQMLRNKNNITIGTAPSFANLDKRVPENTDIWINVQHPGVANIYYVTMDDFTHQIVYHRLRQRGFVERIRWAPIDGDEDYQYLNQTKNDIGVPGLDSENNLSEEDVKEAQKEARDEYIRNLLEMKEEKEVIVDGKKLNQEMIARLAECSQQHVSKVNRGVA